MTPEHQGTELLAALAEVEALRDGAAFRDLDDASILAVNRLSAQMALPSKLGNQKTVRTKCALPAVLASTDRHPGTTFISPVPTIKTAIYASIHSLGPQHRLVNSKPTGEFISLNKPTALLIEVEAHALSLCNSDAQSKRQSIRRSTGSTSRKTRSPRSGEVVLMPFHTATLGLWNTVGTVDPLHHTTIPMGYGGVWGNAQWGYRGSVGVTP